MNGYPCTNAERGCPAKVLKSKDDGKYHEILENGTMGARHYCKFWPKKGENDTPEQVLAEQKKLMSNDQAKEAVKEYNQKFPKEDEWRKEMVAGISSALELATQAILLQRDTIRLAKGEEIEVILAQKDEQLAKYAEIERQRSFKQGNEVK